MSVRTEALLKMRGLVAERGGAGEPDAWRALWDAGLTGWDLGRPTPVLETEASADAVPAGARCLIPGCGGGYDVAALAQGGGGRTVIGLDVSEIACEKAR
jgi:SAM-dependent methyltransferase